MDKELGPPTEWERLWWQAATGDELPFSYQLDVMRHWYALQSGSIASEIMLNAPTGTGKLKAAIVAWYLGLLRNRWTPRRFWLLNPYRNLAEQACGLLLFVRDRLYGLASGRLDGGRNLRQVAEEMVELGRALRVTSPYCGPEADLPVLSIMMGGVRDQSLFAMDPTTPALISGTFHMAGLSPLYSLPGRSSKTRSMYAGLFMCDSVVCLDEVHVHVPAFQMLRDLQAEQAKEARRGGEPWVRPMHLMTLSATPPADHPLSPRLIRPCRLTPAGNDEVVETVRFTISPEDEKIGFVDRVINGPKTISFARPTPQDDSVNGLIARLVLERRDQNILAGVFVNSPEDANEIAAVLRAELGECRVAVVTGTMVTYDRMAKQADPVFSRFVSGEPTDEPFMVIIGTSAINNGLDGSVDFAVMQEDELAVIIQRIGRCGRRGLFPVDIVVAYDPTRDADHNAFIRKSTNFLMAHCEQNTPTSVKLLAAAYREAPPECSRPPSGMLPVSPQVLDRLSMSCIEDDEARKLAQRYLLGTDPEMQTAQIAWRVELDILARDGLDSRPSVEPKRALAAAFRAHPVMPIECLQDRLDRIHASLKLLALRHPDAMVAVLDGGHKLLDLKPLSVVAVESRRRISGRVVVLPVSVGGKGTDGQFAPDSGLANDRSDVPPNRRVRIIAERTDEGWSMSPASPGSIAPFAWPKCSSRGQYLDTPQGIRFRCEESITMPDGRLLLMLGLPVHSPTFPCDQLVGEHNAAVAHLAVRFADGLAMPAEVAAAFRTAGLVHDLGKLSPTWARAMGVDLGYAKQPGKRARNPAALAGGRHEFRSAVVAFLKDAAVDCNDLELFLVASHHGMLARPCMSLKGMVWDDLPAEVVPQAVRPLAERVWFAFDNLTARYGRWGLSWLEASFRAADWTVSSMGAASLDAILDEAGFKGERAERRNP